MTDVEGIDELVQMAKSGELDAEVDAAQYKVPEYRVQMPEDIRIEECEKDIDGAKTMKALREVARSWKVKGYKKFRAKERAELEAHIRFYVGAQIGTDMFAARLASMTDADIEALKVASTAPVPQQRDELLAARNSDDVIEAEVVGNDPADLSEEEFKAALRHYAATHDQMLFRLCDIIPPFLRALRDQEWDGSKWVELTNGEHADAIADVLGDKFDEEEEWWVSDKATELVELLFGSLNEVAPAGFYFGLDVGDQARGFGFWKIKAVNTDVPEVHDLIDKTQEKSLTS